MDSVSNIAGERDLQVATLLNYLTGPHAALPNERTRETVCGFRTLSIAKPTADDADADVRTDPICR